MQLWSTSQMQGPFREELTSCLKRKSLNIYDRLRISGENLRWIDQKLTPDLIMVVCYGVFMLPDELKVNFSNKDLRTNAVYQSKFREYFSKSDPEKAYEEYSKIARQVLNCLAYAGILTLHRKGSANTYSVVEDRLIRDIGTDRYRAFLFLALYIEQFLSDNLLTPDFERYIEIAKSNCPTADKNTALMALRDRYIRFHADIVDAKTDNSLEAGRIFPKIINTIAAAANTYGISGGRLSQFPKHNGSLCYTEANFREKGQDRTLSRAERFESFARQSGSIAPSEIKPADIARAKSIISRLHTKSEMSDGPREHVHHIFMQAERPEFAASVENLMALTVEEHLSKAHPSGVTTKVDKRYRQFLLIKKLHNIDHLNAHGVGDYSRPSFIEIVNSGLNLRMHSQIAYGDFVNAVSGTAA